MSTVVLETRGLVKRFGGIAATNDVSLKVEKGARHALIGPNGAGKTTLINLLTGVLGPTAGTVALDGADITRLAAHRRVRRGLVRTFQINQLFSELTPLQSLALTVSVHLGRSSGWWRSLGADPRVATACEALLTRFRLDEVMNQKVAQLATASGVCSRSRPRWPASRACCCSTSRSPAYPRPNRGRFWNLSPPSPPTSPCY